MQPRTTFVLPWRLWAPWRSTVFARSDAAATIYLNLCGFYSRAVTNRERRLLNSVFSVKFFVIVRALRKASFIRRIAIKVDQPPLCYKAVPTRHFQSVFSFSQWFHTMIALRASKMPNFSGQRAFLYLSCTHLILPFEPEVCSRAHVLLKY